MESTRYVAKEAKIFEFKGLTGKSLKIKEIALQGIVPPVMYPLIDMLRPVEC
jgi:hypothetical protein